MLESNWSSCPDRDRVGKFPPSRWDLFDEWWKTKNAEPVESIARYGTVDWLFQEYKSSAGYLERVSERSRPDYERTMLLLADALTKKGDRVGTHSVKSITPISADKLYNLVIERPHGLPLARTSSTRITLASFQALALQ